METMTHVWVAVVLGAVSYVALVSSVILGNYLTIYFLSKDEEKVGRIIDEFTQGGNVENGSK